MKRLVCFFLAGLLLLLSACAASESASAPVLSAPPTISAGNTYPVNRDLRFSVTQMLADSPLFTQLCAQFEEESGYRISVSVNPDRVAVSVAETGKYDLLIARSGIESSRFVTAGYGTQPIPWFRDAFVLVGPAQDPAAVADAQTLPQAFLRIARFGAAFVSCYDDGDLYRAESDIWKNAGYSIGNGKRWYIAARCSVADSLQRAQEENAYCLATRDAFAQAQDRLSLGILLQNSVQTDNVYCMIPVDPTQFEGVNSTGVEKWLTFVQSQAIRDWIASYGTDSLGSPIFDIME